MKTMNLKLLASAALTGALLVGCASSESAKKPDEAAAKADKPKKKKVETVAVLLGDAEKLIRQDKLDQARANYNNCLLYTSDAADE